MPVTVDALRYRGVHFHVETEKLDPFGTHYASACLAQGMRHLGIPVTGNLLQSPFDRTDPESPGLVIFDLTADNYRPELMRRIAETQAPEKFVVCRADNVDTIILPPEIPLLATHETRARRVTGSRIPWAFGLSEEILQHTAGGLPFEERLGAIVRNFRPSAAQHVRVMLDLTFVPLLEKHLPIDRRHGRDHFERLRSYVGCLAYGGTWEEDYATNAYFASLPKYQEYRKLVTFPEPLAILRWDSWRWWESLAAGCLTFQLDLGKYGMLLPEMPVGWKHYIPIDLGNLAGTVERFLDERPRWAEIAENGRVWARTHYSPEAVASRLIDYAAPIAAATTVPTVSERLKCS
jgi:hypothetical protein